ncbi:DUF2147 domain-containing protein [Aurantimonas sp. VKM B-3413]|uniref:DUF2147 domain-containing protein n=1 Tax=Aurantimonas sp. VKM B-3413 TaxID=2779401 RepID=UPI001E33B267|nr:DUF2147 domain-containing protein [Aurantimonas sp. VKM B-3413]MCB8836063.1 DUF2147 domain-containing protein [Aurantimonas sp. VKM B-3413]
MKTSILALATIFALSTPALSAEPIVGKWRAPGGGIVRVSPCGDAFCATVISGEHKGKSVGQMTGSGKTYKGSVTDPRDDRTYSGTVSISSGSLKLTGCALKIFCKTQTWIRI